MGPKDDPSISSGSSVNQRLVFLSKRGTMESEVDEDILVLGLGVNAEHVPMRASTAAITKNIVCLLVCPAERFILN